MKSLLLSLCSALLFAASMLPAAAFAQKAAQTHVKQQPAPPTFESAAPAALQAMRQQAEQKQIGGAALLAFFEGDHITSWSSKMLVVGRYKDEPTETKKGSNLLAIAYAKASEMADTLKDSGSKIRDPYVGETGWQGGVIVPWRNGYLLAAFSGGKSEDDVAVSRAGIAAMTSTEPTPK